MNDGKPASLDRRLLELDESLLILCALRGVQMKKAIEEEARIYEVKPHSTSIIPVERAASDSNRP